MSKWLGIASLVLALMACAYPGRAGAARVTVRWDNYCHAEVCDQDVFITAAHGERNDVTVSQEPDPYGWSLVIHDAGAKLSGGCPARDDHTVVCEFPDYYGVVMTVHLGDRSDRFDSSAVGWPVWVFGGRDDDRLVTGSTYDELEGGPGSDLIDGGGGVDRLSFSGAAPGLRVDLAAARAQTAGGDRDELRNLEDVSAPAAEHAVLAGDAGRNELMGGAESTVLGREGDDYLTAGTYGRIFGGPGSDSLQGEFDQQTVTERPLELLDCGKGDDSAYEVILPDTVRANCEKVTPVFVNASFTHLVGRPSAHQPFAVLSYACVIPDTGCPLELKARIGDEHGRVVASRREQYPYSSTPTWHEIPLALNASGRTELAERGVMRVVVFYREGPFSSRPRWHARRGFTMVLTAPNSR